MNGAFKQKGTKLNASGDATFDVTGIDSDNDYILFYRDVVPSSDNVYFRCRVLEGGSNADISDVAFTAATPVESIPVNENSFTEVRYDLDETVLSNKSFGTIQFKIVLRSTSTSNVPKIKDFRAICAT